MKLSRFLVGTLACTMFAACSNEESPAVDNGAQGQEGNAYMAVNLVMSAGTGSRAVEDGGYENGTDEEGAVSIANSVFLFYDAAGEYLTKGNIVTDADSDSDGTGADGYLDLTSESQDDHNNELESKSNAVIVLGPTESQPTQVLAVLNGGASTLAGKSLSEALAEVTTSGLGTEKGSFLMTNATYVSGSKIVNATDVTGKAKVVTDGKTEDAIESAKNDPVEIYVERVAAKLTVKESVSEKELSDDSYVLDNAIGVTMKVVIDGWCANATNESSYYVKNLNDSWIGTAPFTNWTGTHRTFWAEDMNYTGEGDYPDGPTYTGLQYKKWTEATKEADAVEYIFENTINNDDAQVEGGDNTNVTTVLVAAHIMYKTSGDETYQRGNIYKHNGVFYTEKGLKDVIVASCDYYWFYTKDGNKAWTPLKADDVTFSFSNPVSAINPGEVTVDVTAITKPTIDGVTDIVLVKGEGTESETDATTEAIAALKGSIYTQNLMGYKNGACYYQIPIEHLSSAAGNEFYGVVRNHSYVLTISDITGIGGAVYDPDKVLPPIPGKDKNYYMAAKLNVLAWKVVEQSAVLN